MTCLKALEQGFSKLGLTLDPYPFSIYLDLLATWNRSFNLTAVKTIEEMVSRHILDSLAISPWVSGSRLLDVGTGAGLPGIPLALANPSLHVVLLDSNGKKTRFLQAVKRTMKLNNIEVIQSRADEFHPSCLFDTIVSRALCEVSQFIDWTKHLLAPNGRWLAMKGQSPVNELAKLALPVEQVDYTVPGLLGERCAIIVQPII